MWDGLSSPSRRVRARHAPRRRWCVRRTHPSRPCCVGGGKRSPPPRLGEASAQRVARSVRPTALATAHSESAPPSNSPADTPVSPPRSAPQIADPAELRGKKDTVGRCTACRLRSRHGRVRRGRHSTMVERNGSACLPPGGSIAHLCRQRREQRVPHKTVEGRTASVCRRHQVGEHRLPSAAGHRQVEQNRASPILQRSVCVCLPDVARDRDVELQRPTAAQGAPRVELPRGLVDYENVVILDRRRNW